MGGISGQLSDWSCLLPATRYRLKSHLPSIFFELVAVCVAQDTVLASNPDEHTNQKDNRGGQDSRGPGNSQARRQDKAKESQRKRMTDETKRTRGH